MCIGARQQDPDLNPSTQFKKKAKTRNLQLKATRLVMWHLDIPFFVRHLYFLYMLTEQKVSKDQLLFPLLV